MSYRQDTSTARTSNVREVSQILSRDQSDVACVVWSPDGHFLASGHEDGTISIWDAKSGEETVRLSGQSSEVLKLSWSEDGRRIASTSLDGKIRVWDMQYPRDEGLTIYYDGELPSAVLADFPVGNTLSPASNEYSAAAENAVDNEPLQSVSRADEITAKMITAAVWILVILGILISEAFQ